MTGNTINEAGLKLTVPVILSETGNPAGIKVVGNRVLQNNMGKAKAN